MAESGSGPNNALIKFRGKPEREMPSVSQKQNRFMHAVAEGKVDGVAPKVGKDFVKADAGRKISKLPRRVRRSARKKAKSMHNRGMISDKAMKKHFGE